mmetsp:Transcript_44619/g.139929  ORF Transcript_44619/g.139929 Transcript_44619/m.139929 type:complete len:371 (-) Transcript_44619:154-1266(-)
MAQSAMVNEREVIRETGRAALVQFLQSQTCYKMVRKSGKVVVFDINIPVQLAFYALVEHDMPVAPLWDNAQQCFVGVLTKYDFIDIMRDYLRRGRTMEELSGYTIRGVISDPPPQGGPYPGSRLTHGGEFGAVDVEASVYEACQRMFTPARHRFLGVVVPAEVTLLAMVSCIDVLTFLVAQFREQRRLFDDSIVDLSIGTYKGILSMEATTRLCDVLDLMEQQDVAAVPITDAEGRMLGAYHRSDIAFIANASDAQTVVRNLEMTIGEIMHVSDAPVSGPGVTSTESMGQAGGVMSLDPNGSPIPNSGAALNLLRTHQTHTCRPTDSLQRIFELFAEVTFERVFVVNEERRCVGVVSARDLVGYLLRPLR